MDENELFEEVLDQCQPLVYHCLWQMRVTTKHPDWEDYYQVGLLALYEATQTSQEDLTALGKEEDVRHSFVAYAKRLILWRMRDYQRTMNRYYRQEEVTEDCGETLCDSEDLGQVLLDQECWERLVSLCTEEELTILSLLLEGDLSIYEMAQALGLGVRAFHRRRRKLFDKLQEEL